MLKVSYKQTKIATHVILSIHRRAGESNCGRRLSKGMDEMQKILYKSEVLHRLFISFGLFTDGRVTGFCVRVFCCCLPMINSLDQLERFVLL